MDKGVKRLIIFFLICIIFTIFGIVVGIMDKDDKEAQKEEKNKIAAENYELIKEEVYNPEVDDIKKVTVKEEDTPVNLKDIEYIVVRKYEEKGKPITWEYSTYLSNLGEMKYKKWSKEDLEKVPVIVFSISDYISRTYDYVVGGSGKATIRSETVNLYFYNTKTKTVFKVDKMEGEELPATTNSSHDYTKSIYDIDSKIKKDFGKFVMSGTLTGILVIAGIILVPTTIALIVGAIKGKKSYKGGTNNANS